MRLLVDAQCVQSSSSLRGIGRYSLNLLRALAMGAGDHQVEVLLNAGDDQDRLVRARTALETFMHPGQVHVYDADWPWHHPRRAARRPAAEAAYAAAVASLHPDVLLVASVFEGDVENVVVLDSDRTGVPSAALLFDLIPAADPGTYLLGPGADDYWRRFGSLTRADLLLSISDYSAAQAAKLLGDRCPLVRTILGGPYPSGDFPAFETQVDDAPEIDLPGRYVLAVGGDHPRKNLDRLVSAWVDVPADLRRRDPLVLACGLNAGTMRRLRRTADAGGVAPDELLVLGRVSDRTLGRLYAGATAFVFPSTEEGLGMPPIEAMAAGVPTLLARSSSLVELTDDPDAFFDPMSAKDIAASITRVLVDDVRRRALAVSATQAAHGLTWSAAAAKAWTALEQVPTARAPARPTSRAARTHPALLASTPGPVLLEPGMLERPPLPAGATRAALATSDDEVQLSTPAGAGVRAALTAATALCTDDPELASRVVQAGALEAPVVPVEALPVVDRHDVRAALAERLKGLGVRGQHARDVVEAASAGCRWTLERPRPVWLLITRSWQDAARSSTLREIASAAGGDLVVAGPAGFGLAMWSDVVAVEGDAVSLDILRIARGRGAVVVALRRDGGGSGPADWAHTASGPSAADPEAWAVLFDQWLRRWGRTTGWPWQDRSAR